jgi:hypothetical protein
VVSWLRSWIWGRSVLTIAVTLGVAALAVGIAAGQSDGGGSSHANGSSTGAGPSSGGGSASGGGSSSGGGSASGGGSSTAAGHSQTGGATSARAAAKDSFKGRILAGASRYAGARGKVTIYLHLHGAGPTRSGTITIRGRCAGAPHCLDLHGKLIGSLTPTAGGLPDVGHAYALRAKGKVSPLGTVTMSGTAHGTGFIARGREEIRLSLTGEHGSVTLTGESGPVPGFTSP